MCRHGIMLFFRWVVMKIRRPKKRKMEQNLPTFHPWRKSWKTSFSTESFFTYPSITKRTKRLKRNKNSIVVVINKTILFFFSSFGSLSCLCTISLLIRGMKKGWR